jgi:hypothetical protein
MQTEHEEPQETPEESTGAQDDDNPTPPDDVGEEGAGTQSGASGGLEGGSEPDSGNG